MLKLNEQFVREEYDKNGIISKFDTVAPDNFNFAYDCVDYIAQHDGDKRALVWCNDSGEEHLFSYRDMSELSSKAANVFTKYGIKKGDTVMLVLKRHYQFWSAILGLHKIGAVVIPATHLLTEKDYVYRFTASGCKAIVCTTENDVPSHVEDAIAKCGGVTVKMTAKGNRDGWVSYDDEMAAACAEFERVQTQIHDPMIRYFTSGTTGHPKMVQHDFGYALAHIFTAKHWQHVDPDGLHLTLADTGWGKAVWGKLYGQWIMESCVFVCDFERFTPPALLALFKKYGITSFCAPPTMFRFFIQEDLTKYDLSSLKYATIAGEALNPEVFNRFYEATGIELMEGFGQTETTLTVVNTVGMKPKPGSMGRPSPQYNVDLADDNGNSVEPGVVGEIVVRATKDNPPRGLFQCYYLNEKLTDEVWHDDIYRSGDTAWKDEDGYYWYVGRTDDIIKSSGYRIGPFEIESVLMEHAAVAECAVTGVPDDIRGQLVKATVVLAKGFEPSEALKADLQNHVKRQTAPYKYPRVVEFVGELPKTISGKIRRVQIREQSK